MPLDPHARRLLDMVAAGSTDPIPATIEARRRAFRALMSFSDGEGATAFVEERSLPGPDSVLRARLYRPHDSPSGSLPGLVFFHGGGLVAGSVETHDPICRVLANETGCGVVSVDYRLAPEHPFPAAVRDAGAATLWVIENATSLGLDSARIGVGGDSAGAALAAVVCQGAGPRPAFQLLLCPITDFAGETRSRQDFATGYLVDAAMVRRDLDHYLPREIDPADPMVSPSRGRDFRDQPPAFIHTAEYDPFRDEGEDYARRLEEAGIAVAQTRHRGMIHLFYALPRAIPYARHAMRQIGAEIKAALRQIGRA